MLIKLCSIFALMTLAACNQSPTSNQVQRRQQEAIAMQGTMAVGMPTIVNFQEKRILKNIYELRDQSIVTITYSIDMNGVLHKICDSIGYGIPASTQYTNPQTVQVESAGGQRYILPQADPNGLFSPSSSEGTWVLCKDPNGEKVAPVYVEPRVIVSPFALK